MSRRTTLAGLVAIAAAAFGLYSSGALGSSDGWETQPDAPAPALAKRMLGELTVAPEDNSRDYDRDEWMDGWDTISANCDARELILAREAIEANVGEDCYPASGRWRGVYTDRTLTRARDVQIDHIVPLEEANGSGTTAWTREQRHSFSHDPENLWAVDGSANQSKGSKDPAQWRPQRQAVWCEYASRWVAVKHKYNLTIDRAERWRLAQMLGTCR